MKYPSFTWLLFVFIAFSITLNNVVLLTVIQFSNSLQLLLTIATIGMNAIVFLYYPFKAINKKEDSKK